MPEYEHALYKAASTQVRYLKMGKADLKVYTRIVNGVVASQMFTLQSLADCMGWGKGAMEQRYSRGRLHIWKHDIQTGEGRPVRGFPLGQLEDVIRVMTTSKAKVQRAGNDDMVASSKRTSASSPIPLEVTKHLGQAYYTMPALARHYGSSVTTIRNKLAKSGLLKKGINLNQPGEGGRPRRGFPEAMLPQLVDAIENGAQFLNEAQLAYNRVMTSSTRPSQPRELTDEELTAQGEAAMRAVFGDQPVERHHTVTDDAADPWSQIEQLKPPAPQIQLPAGNPLDAHVERIAPLDVWLIDNEIDALTKQGFTAGQVQQVRDEVYRRQGIERV